MARDPIPSAATASGPPRSRVDSASRARLHPAISSTERRHGMERTTWTDEFLDELREAGDPPADAVVTEILGAGEAGAVNRLMKTLVRNDGMPPAKLPAPVRDYLAATD